MVADHDKVTRLVRTAQGQLDSVLRMIEEGQHREEIINAGFDSEVVEKIHAMIRRNAEKQKNKKKSKFQLRYEELMRQQQEQLRQQQKGRR